MTSSLLGILLIVLAFISTNLDDLFILVAFFSSKEYLKKEVILGQYLGIVSLISLSSLAYFFQFFIPPNLISLLGIFPILIGIKLIYQSYKNYDDNVSLIKNSSRRYKSLQVALVTFTNGGDNIGVYAPLLAGMTAIELTWSVIIFMVMTGIWCLISIKLVENRIIGNIIKKYGQKILPIVLILIGIAILFRGFT